MPLRINWTALMPLPAPARRDTGHAHASAPGFLRYQAWSRAVYQVLEAPRRARREPLPYLAGRLDRRLCILAPAAIGPAA